MITWNCKGRGRIERRKHGDAKKTKTMFGTGQ